MNFADSVPDFLRGDKGNIRHLLGDIIILMILGRACGHADIIDLGKHNISKYRRMGLLKNGGLSWQPYLLYIVKKICEAVGYSYDFSAWEENEEHRYLLVCNTLPYAWNMPEFARALPHWTVAEFFEKLEPFLEAEFNIDHRGRHIGFDYTKDILAAMPPVAIDKIIDEHTIEVSVEDEKCEYRETKNLVYAECSHEMWKFYSCDWFYKIQ